jgi:hypothetical protein
VKIRAGYDIAFQCPYAVPMVLMLTTHPSRDGDILSDQSMLFSPRVDARDFFDPYGNICTRLVAQPGLFEVRSEFIVQDSGLPDEVRPTAEQWDIADLPGDVLPFWQVAIATPKSCPIRLGRFSGGSRAAGSERRRSVITPMTGSNSVTITHAGTVPRRRAMRSAGAFAGTSPT